MKLSGCCAPTSPTDATWSCWREHARDDIEVDLRRSDALGAVAKGDD